MLTNCEDGTGELEMEIKEDKLQQNEVGMEMEMETKEDMLQQNEARHQFSLWHALHNVQIQLRVFARQP